jgi:hypothetical protein
MAHRPSRPPTLALLAAAALALAGCQDEPITRAKVPKEPGLVPLGRGLRVVAAMVKQDDATWFFKLLGPEAAVARHKAEFESFLKTVSFTPKDKEKPIAWRLPEGWREVPGKSELRFATFRLGPDEAPLEVTVVPFAGEAGGELANVNRWRSLDLGLNDIGQDELDRIAERLKVGGAPATLVDMPVPLSLSFAVPQSWEPGGNLPPGGHAPPGIVRPNAVYVVRDGKESARVTVLGMTHQKLVPNADRWSKMVGLGPVARPEDVKGLAQIAVAGRECDYLDLTGPAVGEAQARRILGVLCDRDGEDGYVTWVFRMEGPAGLVGTNKEAFEAFVRSVSFSDGGGPDDGK